ncbi:MAG: hypothetical protein ACFFC7_19185 [Candidatus Hermodarchaeota archaeon]
MQIIDVTPIELLIWVAEIVFVFLILIVSQYLLDREKFSRAHIGKILIAAILIVVIIPIIGAVGLLIEFQGRTLYPLAVVIVFVVSAFIIRFLMEEDCPKVMILTTILLLILYLIRFLFGVSILV